MNVLNPPVGAFGPLAGVFVMDSANYAGYETGTGHMKRYYFSTVRYDLPTICAILCHDSKDQPLSTDFAKWKENYHV